MSKTEVPTHCPSCYALGAVRIKTGTRTVLQCAVCYWTNTPDAPLAPRRPPHQKGPR